MLSCGNRIVNTVDITHDSYQVDVIDLCEFIQDNFISKGKSIYFLKLDIEGAEFEIIDKLIEQKLHKHIKHIACETHARFFSNGEEKINHLKELINRNNITNIYLDWI